MIIYDHSTNTAQNITNPQDHDGYAHVDMHHLGPIEDHKGLLLVLPSYKYPLSKNFTAANEGKIVRKQLDCFLLFKYLNLIHIALIV